MGGVPFTFNRSVNLEDIPAPPVIDARLLSLEYTDGVFYTTYEQVRPNQRTMMRYRYIGKNWKVI